MYEQVVAVNIGIFMLLAMSLNIITGYAGQPTLGHAAFFGIGAYASALLTAKAGLSFWLALPLAGVTAGAAGALTGLFSVRVRDDFLAIVTMGVNFVVVALFQYVPFFGASLGLAVPPATFAGARLDAAGYLVILAVLNLVVFLFCQHLGRSWLGLALGGIRNNEAALASLGYDVSAFKVFAFVIGTAVAGLAGSVYAHFMGFIMSTDFAFPISVSILSMAVLGGLGTAYGPLLGAAVLVIAPEVFRFVSDYRMLIYGALLMGMMRFQPQGLLGEGSVLTRLVKGGGKPWRKSPYWK